MIGTVLGLVVAAGGAVALALGLPRVVAIDGLLAWLAGGGFAVFVLLGQEMLARRWQAETMAERLAGARLDLAKTQRELLELQSEVVRLHEAVGQGSTRNSELISEMRMIRGLLGKLDPAKRAPAPAAAAVVAKGTPRRAAEHQGLDHDTVLEITRQALANNRVDLYLQPVVELPSRKVRYYEAVSRIRDEAGTLVLPEQYLPVAVEAGLIGTIDNLLLFRCVQLIRRAQRDRVSVGFFCNVSADSLTDREFLDQFVEYMEMHKELASTLMFELGQGEAQRPGVTAALVPLRRLGFSFALDRVSDLSVDFAKLAQVGFKTVKVEAARLLGDMARSGTHPKLPELAEALRRAGVALIADKIENEAAAERLARFGVTLGQGFLFGEPRIAGDGR